MSPQLALAFSAGVVATINPCGFAMLPAYLAYYLGLDASDGAPDRPTRDPVLRAISVSCAVGAGLLTVFVLTGLVWSTVSDLIGQRLPYVSIAVGAGLVGLGVAMLCGFTPTTSIRVPRFGRQAGESSSMYLYGVTYAIVSLGCTLPVFIAVVASTLQRSSFPSAFGSFIAYGLGMSGTLTILTIAIAAARTGVVRAFRRLLPHLSRISGGFLVLAGSFSVYYAIVSLRELDSGDSSVIVEFTRSLQNVAQHWVETLGAPRLALSAAIIIVASAAVSRIWRTGRRANSPRSPEHQPPPGSSLDRSSS